MGSKTGRALAGMQQVRLRRLASGFAMNAAIVRRTAPVRSVNRCGAPKSGSSVQQVKPPGGIDPDHSLPQRFQVGSPDLHRGAGPQQDLNIAISAVADGADAIEPDDRGTADANITVVPQSVGPRAERGAEKKRAVRVVV